MRSLTIGFPSSYSFIGYSLRVPKVSSGGAPIGTRLPRSVTLVAQVWDAGQGAYVNRLRASVVFPDTASPSTVQVRNWSVLR